MLSSRLQKKANSPGGTVLQRSASRGPAVRGPVPSIVHNVLNTPGQPLDGGTRSLMEPRFGHDFSRVRIHADSAAAESARSVDAQAYTVGNHVVFGNGNHEPQSLRGRKLMAHELAHTVQQSRPGLAAQAEDLQMSRPGDAGERQADEAAEQAVHGRRPVSTLEGAPGMRLQRQKTAASPKAEEKKPGPAERQLSKDIHEAALQALRKVKEKGLDKLPPHIPTGPQQRPAQDNAQPKETPKALPAKPATSPEAPKSKNPIDDVQVAGGLAGQTGGGAVTQAGGDAQAAIQFKDFLAWFHGRLGLLQPTLALNYTHLYPIGSGSGSLSTPPPDTLQLSFVLSPVKQTLGEGDKFHVDLTLPIGLAGSVGLAKSPTLAALGIFGAQADVIFAPHWSATLGVGGQVGEGVKDVGWTGTLNITFHLSNQFKND